MISLLKGSKLNVKEFEVLILSCRDKRLVIHNLKKELCDPYLGAKLNIEQAKELKKWLEEVIELSKICDACYNFKKPDNFNGKLICNICGNEC